MGDRCNLNGSYWVECMFAMESSSFQAKSRRAFNSVRVCISTTDFGTSIQLRLLIKLRTQSDQQGYYQHFLIARSFKSEAMTVHSIWVINKAGGLVFSRSYSSESGSVVSAASLPQSVSRGALRQTSIHRLDACFTEPYCTLLHSVPSP